MKVQMETNWSRFLKLFSELNRNRPTRLGVFKGLAGHIEDYWLEDRMPLAGVDLDLHGSSGPEVEIMLDGIDRSDHMSHRVFGVRMIKITLSLEGDADGLEIVNDHGETTLLRFENQPAAATAKEG